MRNKTGTAKPLGRRRLSGARTTRLMNRTGYEQSSIAGSSSLGYCCKPSAVQTLGSFCTQRAQAASLSLKKGVTIRPGATRWGCAS